MKQRIFSNLIFDFLGASYPEFVPSITYSKDGSFDCRLNNQSKEFAIWITTYNTEITFGIEAPNGEKGIHTHISCYEIYDLEDCVTTLSRLIDEIWNNEVILYCNKSGLYDWIEHTRLIQKENQEKTTYQRLYWNTKN